jgi:hypothetical protein
MAAPVIPVGGATADAQADELAALLLIAADVDKIPAQGQALAAASMPVVLPAAQVTALTPPTAAAVAAAIDAGKLTEVAAALGAPAGWAVVTDDAGTVQQYLRGLVKLIVDQITVKIAAGVALIGKVGIDQTTPGTTNAVAVTNSFALERASYDVALAIQRTANTAAYLAGDVIGTGTAAAGAALTFAAVGPASGPVMITSAELLIENAAVPSGMTSFRLYLYSITPPSALGDNAPFDLPIGDRPSYLGYIDLGTPADLGSSLHVQTTFVGKDLKLAASGSVFGYLVTNGAYTPASGTIYTVTLHTSAR